MVQPASILNDTGQKLPVYIGPDGEVRLPMVIGAHDVGLEPEAGRVGVASHVNGDVVAATDGVVVQAGVNGAGEATPILVDSTGRPLVASSGAGGTLTDRSGPIVSGGTSEVLAPVNAARKYLFVQNLSADEDLWIDFTVDALADAPSIRLEPGQSFVMEGNFVSTEEVNVFATTTGHEYTAKEG